MFLYLLDLFSDYSTLMSTKNEMKWIDSDVVAAQGVTNSVLAQNYFLLLEFEPKNVEAWGHLYSPCWHTLLTKS